jgi:hypothetical protein
MAQMPSPVGAGTPPNFQKFFRHSPGNLKGFSKVFRAPGPTLSKRRQMFPEIGWC